MKRHMFAVGLLGLTLSLGCADSPSGPSDVTGPQGSAGPFIAQGEAGLGLVAGGVGLSTQPGSFSVDVPAAASDVVSATFYWSGRGGNDTGDDSIVINGMTYDGSTTPAVELASSYPVNLGTRWAFFYKLNATSLIDQGTNSFEVEGFDLPADTLEDGIGLVVVYSDAESDCREIHVVEPYEFVYWADPDFPQGMVHSFAFPASETVREARLVLFAGDAKPDRPDTIWWTTGEGTPPANLIGGAFPTIENALVSANGPEFDVLDVTPIPVPADADYFAYQLESPEPGDGDSMLHSYAAFCVSTPDIECTGRIGDFVWYDENGNGLQDAGEPGIEGVTVTLCDDTGAELDSDVTGPDGEYLFADLCAGDYEVKVDEATLPEGLIPCPCNVGDDDTIDNDCSPASVTLEADDAEDLTIDFGYCDEPEGDEGCTPGYWKNHPVAWEDTGFSPAQTVESVFSEAAAYEDIAASTLMEALRFHGGNGVEGGARILLRAAVASVLNASHPDVDHPDSVGNIVEDVNGALASGDRDEMLVLASWLDDANNLGCPLGRGGSVDIGDDD